VNGRIGVSIFYFESYAEHSPIPRARRGMIGVVSFWVPFLPEKIFQFCQGNRSLSVLLIGPLTTGLFRPCYRSVRWVAGAGMWFRTGRTRAEPQLRGGRRSACIKAGPCTRQITG
jgi:hypothetical protein